MGRSRISSTISARKIRVDYDTTSAITTLTVRAYTPQDAQKFNRQLLELAEETVNRLNRRGRADVVQLSEQEVRDAQKPREKRPWLLAQFRERQRDHRSGEAGRCPAANGFEASGRIDRLEDAVAAASGNGAGKSADPDSSRCGSRALRGKSIGSSDSLRATAGPFPPLPPVTNGCSWSVNLRTSDSLRR